MAILFNATSKKDVPPLVVLQCFHLILANSTQLETLVYLFSLPALHSFLLTSLNWQEDDTVEYLVQLLKSIIMRMQGASKSLIKMFINSRHPSFPLLTAATTLATHPLHDQLVTITARQCVLLLVGVLDEKDVARNYLSDLQMMVFFHQITIEINQEDQKDKEGLIKYLAELFLALHHTPSAQALLLSTSLNINIIRMMHSPPTVLNFVTTFLSHLTEVDPLPSSDYTSRCISILTHIVNSLFFNRFVHSTYLACMKLLPNRSLAKSGPDISKYI